MGQSLPRSPSSNPSTEQEWISTALLAPKPGASTTSKKRDGNGPHGRRLTRDELLPKSLLGHYLSSVPILRAEKRGSSRHILNSTSSLASTEITGTMAEAIGIASGLLALGQFAFQSSVALYETINSYQSHQQRVRELAEEAGALSEVLGSLVETVKATTDIDLSSLEVPLRQCGKACQAFEQQIKKVSSRSTATRTSLRDWAKLRYMGEDMDGFRRLLAGYKMTITIALTDANLRRSAATAENIEGYNDLICSAREQFEDRLEEINEKLDELLGKSVSDSTLDTSELMQIKEEKLSTEKSLAIVAQLSSHIAELQVKYARDPAAGTAGSSNNASISEKITHEGLQECQHSLTRMAAKLKEHERLLFNRLTEKMKASSSTPEEAADIARLREEWESTFESMNILSKAGSYFEKETSVIENHATGDAHQVMVATDEKTLHGTNRGLGWRSRQIGGRMNDETVRQISRDMVTVTIRNVYDEQPSARKGTPTGPADREPVSRHTEFHERYGEGFKLTSMK